jgi:hypothetical protein
MYLAVRSMLVKLPPGMFVRDGLESYRKPYGKRIKLIHLGECRDECRDESKRMCLYVGSNRKLYEDHVFRGEWRLRRVWISFMSSHQLEGCIYLLQEAAPTS